MTTEQKKVVNELWDLWERLAEHGEIYIGKNFCKTYDLLKEKVEAINYNRCCKPKGNSKITALVTYWKSQESGHAMLDDTKNKTTKIVEVEKLVDINEMFTNLVDVKILK